METSKQLPDSLVGTPDSQLLPAHADTVEIQGAWAEPEGIFHLPVCVVCSVVWSLGPGRGRSARDLEWNPWVVWEPFPYSQSSVCHHLPVLLRSLSPQLLSSIPM